MSSSSTHESGAVTTVAAPAADSSSALASRGRAPLASLSRAILPLSLLAMVLVFAVLTPETFVSQTNLQNLLDQCVVPALLACGVTFVMSVGEFDLAFTSVIGLAAALTVVEISEYDVHWAFAVLSVLPMGVVTGVVIGVLVTWGRASSFIITLATGSALIGLELALTGNQTIYQNIPSQFGEITSRRLAGTHLPVWFALAVVLLAFVLLHKTRFGRHAQSLGGNAHAAHLAGIRVRRIRIACFVISAVVAALAAVILTSRASSYYPNTSANFLLSTYTAVFLGATAGRTSGFTIPGSVLGVVWIIVLQTGLTLNNAPTWSASMIQGAVLAAAVIIGARTKSAS